MVPTFQHDSQPLPCLNHAIAKKGTANLRRALVSATDRRHFSLAAPSTSQTAFSSSPTPTLSNERETAEKFRLRKSLETVSPDETTCLDWIVTSTKTSRVAASSRACNDPLDDLNILRVQLLATPDSSPSFRHVRRSPR